MKILKYIFIINLFLVQISCIDEALFNAGPISVDTIDIPDFSVIEAQNTFEIELVPDTINKVVVNCGENLHSFINIKVVDDVLYLDHNIKNNWSRKYEKVKLILHSKPFSQINARKPVKVFNKMVYKGSSFEFVDWEKYSELDLIVDVDYFLLAMSSDNFGQYKIKGKATDAQIWGWGSCVVRADSLITNNCNVLHRGMGNVYVNANNILNVSIQFSGNVYYSGNPSKIIVDNSIGTGKLYIK